MHHLLSTMTPPGTVMAFLMMMAMMAVMMAMMMAIVMVMFIYSYSHLPSADLNFCWMERIFSFSFSSLSTAFSADFSNCFMFSPTA